MRDDFPKWIINPLIFRWIMTILMGGTFYFTYEGERYSGSGVGSAAIYAGVTTAAIYIVWHAAFKVIPRLETSRDLIIAAVMVTIISVGMIFPMSSQKNMEGAAGPKALQQDVRRTVREFGVALKQSEEISAKLRELLPVLQDQAQLFYTRHKAELERGEYTGRNGPGSVEDALLSISERLNKLAIGINDDSESKVALSLRAQEHLDAMRKIANVGGSHDRRMERVLAESEKFRSVIASMNSRAQALAVAQGLQGLVRELDIRSTPSGRRSTRESQEKAFARLRGELNETVEDLMPLVDRIIVAPRVLVPVMEQITAQEAVRIYWRQFLGQWAFSIGLDIAPGVILAFVMLRLLSMTREERELERMSQKTFKDGIEFRTLLAALVDGLPNTLVKGRLNEHPFKLSEQDELPAPEHNAQPRVEPSQADRSKVSKTRIFKQKENGHDQA